MSDKKQSTSSSAAKTTLAMVAAAGAGALLGYLASKLINESDQESTCRPMSQSNIPIQPPKACSICLDELSGDLEQLPCMHLYHRQCLARHLSSRPPVKCPVCRQTLSTKDIEAYRQRCAHA